MTSLASVDTTAAASSLLPCVRRPGGVFSPIIGGPMSDNNAAAGCGGGGGGGSGGGGEGLSNGIGRWKRDLEPGGCEEAPPAKRVSPTARKPRGPENPPPHQPQPHQAPPGRRFEARRPGDPPPMLMHPQGETAEPWGLGHGGAHLMLQARETALAMGRARTTSPAAMLATAASAAPTAPTATPATAAAAIATASAPAAIAFVGAKMTPTTERPPSPPPRLWEKPSAMANGDPPHRPTVAAPPPPPPQGGAGGAAPKAAMPLPLTGAGCRRDILKPFPAKHNIGFDVEKGTSGVGGGGQRAADTLPLGGGGGGGGGSDGGSPNHAFKSMKRPLSGGMRPSSSWDGTCASNATLGGGRGNFSAPSACRSCGGGKGSELGDCWEGKEACSCRGVRLSTATCPSPLPFARSISAESSSGLGVDERRNSVGDSEAFHDTLFAHGLGLPSSPSAEPQGNGGGGGGGGGGGIRRGVSAGSGVGSLEPIGGGGHAEDGDELDMLMPDDMHDIQDCMRTLQGSPTHADHNSEHVTSLHASLGFDIPPFDESVHHDEHHSNDVGGGGGGSTGDGDGGMDVEAARSYLNGEHHYGGGQEEYTGVAAAAALAETAPVGGEAGPRVGDDHQAVIPNLSSLGTNCRYRLAPARPPPLQLWRPGVLPQSVLNLVYPRPRRDGAGSAEMEQKMLSAFLVVRATEAEKMSRRNPPPPPEGGEGQPGGAAAATATAADAAGAGAGAAAAAAGGRGGAGKGLARSADGGGGGGGCCSAAGAEERNDSLENLAAFVAAGEGGRWRTDWNDEDRAAFRRGIFAFRRDFHRVRAMFLPHRKYGDVVEYFYSARKPTPSTPPGSRRIN
ncbi:unnamed protein product [Laminaria digitata]